MNRSPKQRWTSTLLPVVGAAVAGNAFVGRDSIAWFRRLRRPPMQLPLPAFYAVGVVYYAAMGVTVRRAVLRDDGRAYRRALVVLVGNEIWNAYFFGRRSTRNGFLGVLAFLPPLAALQVAVADDPASSAAVGVYSAWVVGYDVPWSYQLWRLNPHTADQMVAVERSTRVIHLSLGPLEYRLEERGPRVVLMLHGGHMRAALPLGEDVFVNAGYTVLAPSRPGYGRTPLTTGRDPEGFAEVVAELCGRLDISRLAAVVGQSAGGPTAVALAAREPDLVERLILQSAVGFLPWPDLRTRIGGRCVFAPHVERVTWALIHALIRRAPERALGLLLRDLTRGPADHMISRLSPQDRTDLLGLFARMRSGAGFAADLRAMSHGRADVPRVTRPTLVIATPGDGAVPIEHARSLTAAIFGAHLVLSRAPSHFIWFGDDYPAIATTMTEFLARPLA